MLLACKAIKANRRVGADVILIHGTGSSSQMWTKQAEHLVELGHDCYLIDLRGHGETHEPFEKTDLEAHVGDVLETVQASGVSAPAVWVGHSLGAILSLAIAHRNPEMVDQLFLAALPAGPVFPGLSAAFKVFLSGPFQAMQKSKFREKLAWRERTLLSTDVFSLGQIVEHFSEVEFINENLSVSCPIHFSAGLFDPVAPYHHVRKLHKRIPHSTMRLFEMGGHNFMDYNTDSFNQWLTEKLSVQRS